MSNILYLKRVLFAVGTMVTLAVLLPQNLKEALGMFAIGWCLVDVTAYLFPNKGNV